MQGHINRKAKRFQIQRMIRMRIRMRIFTRIYAWIFITTLFYRL